jgi:DivIVA domain-containing protein
VSEGNGKAANTNGGPRWPLSPNAIRGKRFSPQGRRGYDRDEVDLFMSQVAADLQLWIDEVTRQRTEIERLKDWIRQQHYRTNGDGDSGARISVEAVGVLARAQHHADLVVATAHDQARAIVGDADAQAHAIVESARLEADRAAQAYRASAGISYSPEGEELRRRLAILQTFLGTLTAVQAQLPAVQGQLSGLVAAFAYEVERLQDLVAGDGPFDPHPTSPAFGTLR